jgi:hypothetical protein
MHACDNPSCCRPSHLSEGTPKENEADMTRKGRRRSGPRYGSEHHHAVLDEMAVRRVRERVAVGERQSLIAAELGVSPSTINAVVKRRIWRHAE